MLAYRATPLAVGYTPSELMMGCKLRTTIPITKELRRSMVPGHSAVTGRDRRGKERQAKNFNSHHGARSLPTLQPGDTEVAIIRFNLSSLHSTSMYGYITQGNLTYIQLHRVIHPHIHTYTVVNTTSPFLLVYSNCNQIDQVG